MILIILFALIAAVVIVLNIWDNTNLDKIEKYFKAQQCVNVSYIQGQYQGLCPTSIMLIKNGFSVDISKDKNIVFYEDIKDMEVNKKKIQITSAVKTIYLEFKEENIAALIYKKVEEKR